MSDQNNQYSYLIDTNIVINLEDNRVVKENYANFLRIAAKYKISVFIHEATKDDVLRDKNIQRRKISLSKIEKYQIIEKRQNLRRPELEASFGCLKNDNDVIDAILLHSLNSNVVSFLVTEDKGLHNRAQKYSPELEESVLFIDEAINRIKQDYEPQSVPVCNVEEVQAHTIDYTQTFFDSLRESYSGFDKWWRNKCIKQHRLCWVVRDNNNELEGLVVLKEEDCRDTDAVTKVDKILKICTFKISERKRGRKLGELLLRKILWYAQKNGYNLTYLTVYQSQDHLIRLIDLYGFCNVKKDQDQQEELVYERCFASIKLSRKPDENLFDTDRKNYPRFVVDKETDGFIIPIQEEYHDILYPDLCQNLQLNLFRPVPRKPGNTIRKVYLCRAPSNLGDSGSILFFYKSKSENLPSQAITALGILENVTCAISLGELTRLTDGRSVYSEVGLEAWKATSDNPVKVINYLFVSYIEKPIEYSKLTEMNVIKRSPRSICRINNDSLRKLLSCIDLGFEI